MSSVNKDDEPLCIVEVAIGHESIGIHDVRSSCSSSVTLLVKNKHEPEVDDVRLGVMDVQGVLDLDGGEDDLPANSATGTISNGDLIDSSPAKGIGGVGNTIDGEGGVNKLGLDTRGLKATPDASSAREPTKTRTSRDDGGGGSSSFLPSGHERTGSRSLKASPRGRSIPNGEP